MFYLVQLMILYSKIQIPNKNGRRNMKERENDIVCNFDCSTSTITFFVIIFSSKDQYRLLLFIIIIVNN